MKPSVNCGCQRVSRQSACAAEHPPSQSRLAWFRQALMTLISVFLLILMPKCPLCLAAWITCLTGVGLSLTVASWLRLFLIGGSSGVLILVILIRLRRVFATRLTTERTLLYHNQPELEKR